MQIKNLFTLSGLALAALTLAAPSMADDSQASAPAYFPASAIRGQIVYVKDCAACHGENGNGAGPGAGPLDPKPRDFTTGMYKYRSTAYGEIPTDGDLLRAVNEGVAHSQMPPWKHVLSEQEKVDVVAYIKGFSDAFKDTSKLDTLEVPEAPPLPVRELVQEGRQVFMTLECWSCHGVSGKGDGKSAVGLVDNWGNPIHPINFTWKHYKRGNDPESIYKTLNTGLNGTPMISFAGSFLFGGDKQIDSATQASFSASEISNLEAYFKSQPTDAQINAMTQDQKNQLDLHRKWALVHYLRSLIRKPNALEWLFTDDMELTH